MADEGWANTAKGILSLVLFFAAAALIAQIFFGQIGNIATQFPVEQSNPFYNAYQSITQALTTGMQSLAPLFVLIVAIIALGLVWTLVKILT
ncbi:MAG: hypothetical protein QW794_02875 [Thermosphaera sp.]